MTDTAQDLRSALEQCNQDNRIVLVPVDLYRQVVAVLAQPAENAKGGEVVAWMYERTMGDGMVPLRIVQAHKWTDYDRATYSEAPLYDHPPAAEPAGLREAASAMVESIDSGIILSHDSPSVHAARAALSTPAPTDDAGVGGDIRETSEYLITLLGKAVRGEIIRDMAEAIGAFRQSVAALSPAPDRGEVEASRLIHVDYVARARIIAKKAWEAVRPVGGKFWNELPDDVQTLAICAARDGYSNGRDNAAALKPADATPARAEKMRRTLEFIRDTDASAKFLREAAKTTLAALSTPPALDEGEVK